MRLAGHGENDQKSMGEKVQDEGKDGNKCLVGLNRDRYLDGR